MYNIFDVPFPLVISQLEPFLTDDGGEQSVLCPEQTGSFMCTVTGTMTWRLDGRIVFQFLTLANSPTMFDNEFGVASVLKMDDQDLTSVMVLNPFPTTDFEVTCNEHRSEIKFIGTV